MKSFLTVILLALLGGCTSIPSPVPADAQAKVYALEVAYEAPLTLAVAYNKLPRCTAPKSVTLCSDQGVVDQLRKANHAALAAMGAAASVAATPGASADALTAANSAATNAVQAFASIVAIYAAKK